MDLILSVPLLTPSTSYSKWKLKTIASVKRQGLYEVSMGLGKESYKYENDWLTDGDRESLWNNMCGLLEVSKLALP